MYGVYITHAMVKIAYKNIFNKKRWLWEKTGCVYVYTHILSQLSVSCVYKNI